MKNRFLLYVGVSILLFGTINISIEKIAQAQSNQDDQNQMSKTTQPPSSEYVPTSLQDMIVLNLLGQVGPIVGGIVTIGISFARKQGLKISADAEEYLVKSTKSFVETQSRMIYREIKNNKEYAEYLKQGIVPDDLKKKALESVKNQLLVEMRSDEFTRTARVMLQDNAVPLIERFFTEHKIDMAEKKKNMFAELVPLAVDSVLLSIKTPDEANTEKDRIVSDALKILEKGFDDESILFSNDIAETYIKAELNKRIGGIR